MRLTIRVDLKKIDDIDIVETDELQAWQADIKIVGMMGGWKVNFAREIQRGNCLKPYYGGELFYELSVGVSKGRNYYDIFSDEEIKAIYNGIMDFVMNNRIEEIKWFEFQVEQKFVIEHIDNSIARAERERIEREEYHDIPF